MKPEIIEYRGYQLHLSPRSIGWEVTLRGATRVNGFRIISPAPSGKEEVIAAARGVLDAEVETDSSILL